MTKEEKGSISSGNLPNLSNKLEEERELRNIPYVNDLCVKIEVLKKGIIEGRKKNSALTAQNKQLEIELDRKENEIRKLCKEKVDLENQLQLEKKKLAKKEESFLNMANAFGNSSAINKTNKFGLQSPTVNNTNKFGLHININNIFKKNEEKTKENENTMINFINNNETIDNLNAEIEKLKLENGTYKKKYSDLSIHDENLKNELKGLIKAQSEKIFNIEENNKQLKIENQKLLNELEQKNKIMKEINEKKLYFERMIQELEENKKIVHNQLQNCLNKCEKLVLENQTYRERLHQHQIDETMLGEKLAEYKNIIIKINTKVQIYQVLKVGLINNSRMDITFGQDKDNNYVMRIDDDSKKVELINILDVNYFKLIGKNRVEISYMYESRKKTFTVIVEEIIIDQFMDAYKNFFSEAIKAQTKD